jgi:hypothetical protein
MVEISLAGKAWVMEDKSVPVTIYPYKYHIFYREIELWIPELRNSVTFAKWGS